MLSMFERYTDRACQVIVLAEQEVHSLHHERIGTEHILLGLLCEEEGIACQVLEWFDITVERVRLVVIRIVGVGDTGVTGDIPFTHCARKVLELATAEALRLGHNHVGTEHILLGLMRENGGNAASILLDFDVDADKIRNEVIRQLCGPAVRSKPSAGSPPAIGDRIDALELQISRLFSSSGGDAETIRRSLQCLHGCRDQLASAGLL